MKTYNTSIEYIHAQESTNISYAKLGNSAKKLVVSFGHNGHDGFARKKSLIKLRSNLPGDDSFDILYIRNRGGWYLGELKGIGENVNHTITFLKNEFTKYDKVCCIGDSAGGYASLLFGSILSVDLAIAINAQTDLEHVLACHHKPLYYVKNNIGPDVWHKYNKISTIIDDEVEYIVSYSGDKHIRAKSEAKLKQQNIASTFHDLLLHGDHNFDNIKNHSSVQRIPFPAHDAIEERFLKQ